MNRLLLVEDNDALREQMKWALNDAYDILEANSGAQCLETFEKAKPCLVCLDMGLDNKPDKGLEILDGLLTSDRHAKIIVITANTSESLGSEAVAKGAFDYLRKPVEIEDLRVILRRAARLVELESRPESAAAAHGMQFDTELHMIGTSEPMRKIFGYIEKLARTDVNVLITGESGTGKELCARAIHYHSARRQQTFVPINCGAIPETLLESELFGYARGAFTGANSDKAGLIESADHGTLFLDEIGDMNRVLQVKLLRFLEDQRVQRLGETSSRAVDVRILAATNKTGISETDCLRNDLYYRLSEFEIHLPALRDRTEDIIQLAKNIVLRNRVRFNQPKLELSDRAAKLLLSYDWPGNIRELENKLNRAAITCQNQMIESEDLQLSASSCADLSLKEARDLFEKHYVINALRKAKFNLSDTAKLAGISRPTLYDLLRKHNVKLDVQTQVRQS